MRLVSLGKNLEAERGADAQNLAGSQMHGSQAGGSGARTQRIENIEVDGTTEVRGGISKRHPTLAELKRYLWAKNGPAKHINSLLGRD